MTAWLLVLVMVPVLTVVVLAGTLVLGHRSAARAASAVNTGVARITDLAAVRGGVLSQQSLEAFGARFDELDVTTADASEFLGIDLAALVGPARTRTNEAVAAMSGDSPISQSALDDLYAAIDGRDISHRVAARRLADLAYTVDLAIGRNLDALSGAHGGTDRAIGTDLASLRAVLTIDRVNIAQGIDLSAVWFPPTTATPPTIATALVRLAGDTADYGSAYQRARDLAVGPVAAGLKKIEADSGVYAFETAVSAALHGKPVALPGADIDAAKVVTIFRGYLSRATLLHDLVATNAGQAGADARRRAASEQNAFLAWAAITGALTLISIKLAMLSARWIATPVRALGDYVHALGQGHLDAPGADRRAAGPRETRMALAVVTDLAGTLRLIDAKANALATCALDDPVLSQPLPGRLGRSLERSVTLLVESTTQRDAAWRQSVQRLARAVELRDDATGHHIERVAVHCELIARGLGLPGPRCALIREAAPLHDLGKIAIPDQILLKPGPLTRQERQLVERHCEIGYDLLARSGSDLLELAATIALTHHEHHDGAGYPHHLAGADIPLEGRIAAVADVFDALTSDRVYRQAMTISAAVERMISERGSHFDPDILDVFLHLLDDVTTLSPSSTSVSARASS